MSSSRPRLRRAALRLLGLAGLTLAGALIAAFAHLRHVPYAIPADEKFPAGAAAEPLSRAAAALSGSALDPGAASSGSGLSLRFLGTTGYEISDGKTVILLDPTPTRPGLGELLTGPIDSNDELSARYCPSADFILVSHAHHDHVLDVPSIALRTGATVIGSRSACRLALSRGVPKDRVREAHPGERFKLGGFTVEVRGSRHAPLFGFSHLMEGDIPREAGRLWFWQYRQDASLAFRLEAAGAAIWFYPSSAFEKGDIAGPPAGTLILGVNGLAPTAERMAAAFAEARPRRVLPTHYDNFFQPLSKGLAMMPGLDIEGARRAAQKAAPGLPWHVLDFGERVRLAPDDPR